MKERGLNIKSTKISKKKMMLSLLVIVLFCGLIYIPSAFHRDLHYRDELRYVEVAREMLVNHQWLVPHLGGRFYSDKPPVYFWVLNLFKLIFGNYSTLAMVLPSIISSTIVVILTFFIGGLFMQARYALLAALVLATSFLFFGMSIFVRMDMMMNLFITGSFLVFFRGYCSEKEIKGRYYQLMFFLMGIATVIKGPAGFLDPLVVIIVFLLLEKNLNELKRMNLFRGILIFFAVVLLWIIPAVIIGGKDYAYDLLIVQTFGRSVDSFAHQRAIYYYFTMFPLTFLPWSLFLISSFLCFFNNIRTTRKELKFLFSWFWMPLLIFSMLSGKLDIYLLPIYPAASLLVAILFREILENKANKRYLTIPAVMTAILFVIMAFLMPKIIEGITVRSILKPTLISIVLSSIIVLFLLVKKRYKFIPYIFLVLIFVFWLNFSWGIVTPLSATYTKKPIATKIEEFKKEGVDNIVAYEYGQPESLGVYTDFIIPEIKGEENLFNYIRNKKEVLIIMKVKYWKVMQKKLFKNFQRVYSYNDYLLLLKQ
ncbi:phospholipid carrier-dependent glycosyltransferase [Iocasia frigidifontis]|uniref:Phospholipid carrier-dependent glycosyltransferase n=1 Tax=Iocasia fonsfrigidae TaxID=2682810 RepID=A0A8A7KCE3_9FIRM|nr:phospholipid carrier-dependent glycosyltransferase [Iocasia fonsfrigidae]